MLQLFNKGRNPFPHLKGKGGLQYHPYRHMIGGQSIIKPKERVPYFDAHIIGGMIGGEEHQLESQLSPQQLQTYNQLIEHPEEDVNQEEPEEDEEVTEITFDPNVIKDGKIIPIGKINMSQITNELSKLRIDASHGTKIQLYEKLVEGYIKKSIIDQYTLLNKKYKDLIKKYVEKSRKTNDLSKLFYIINDKYVPDIQANYINEITDIYKKLILKYKTKDEYIQSIINTQAEKIIEMKRKINDNALKLIDNLRNRENYNKLVSYAKIALDSLYKSFSKFNENLGKSKSSSDYKKIEDEKKAEKSKAEEIARNLKEKEKILEKLAQKRALNEKIKERQKSDKILIDDFKSLYTDQEQSDILEEVERQLNEYKILSQTMLGTLNYMISEKYAENAKALKSNVEQNEEKEIEPIKQDYVDAKLKAYNKVTKGHSITKEIENAYEQGVINNSTYTAIINGMKLKYPELNAIYEAKKAGKTLTGAEMQKLMKSFDTSHGDAFESIMTGPEGKKFMTKLTGSDSEIIPTDQSKNIDHIIVGHDSNGFPITLAESCVVDAYNDKACFEFKARISSKGAIDYSKVDYIGLTDTKLSNNVSFRLVFDKTSDGKFKIKNVNIIDPRNKSKKLFTDDISKDYYAIFLFSDLKVYYYDILDDMTDDVNDYGDNGKKKGILVEELLDGTYQFDQCNYELKTTSIGKEYQIPKNKIHKII